MKEQCSHNIEYSFLHVIQLLWQKKLLIICSTLFFTSLSVLVYFVYTPSYVVKATIAPPLEAEVVKLNKVPIFSNHKFSEVNFNLMDIFLLFNRVLKSESTKQAFFKQIYYPSLSEKVKDAVSKNKLYNDYQKKIIFTDQYHLKSSIIKITDANPKRAQKMLNNYLAFAQKVTLRALFYIVERQQRIIESRALEQTNLLNNELKKDNHKQTVKNEIINKDLLTYQSKYVLILKSTLPKNIKLFHVEESPILIRKPTLKQFLLLGFWGGLLISFLIASVGVAHKPYTH